MHTIKVRITAEDFDKFIKEHLCKEDADKYVDYEWVPAKIEITEFLSIEVIAVPTKCEELFKEETMICPYGYGVCTIPNTKCPNWNETFCQLDDMEGT